MRKLKITLPKVQLPKLTFKPKKLLLVAFLVGFYGYMGYTGWIKADPKRVSGEVQTQLATQLASADTSNAAGIKRAQIALAEYRKGVREDKKGCNCGAEVDKYTLGLHKQWCAMFASWVMRQAGTPLTTGASTDPTDWRKTKARSIGTWLDANGTWYSRDEVIKNHLQPQVGDVVVFYRGDFEGDLGHADIVVAVDPSKPGYADLVGGNLDDKVMYRKNVDFADHYGFLGFGRPNNPSDTAVSALR